MKEQNCMSHFFHRRSGSYGVFSFSVMSPRRGSIRRPRNGKIVSYDKDSTMKVLNRLFIALTAIGLTTTLAPVTAHAGRIAFDHSDNLFVADPDSASILKFTSDGKRSTFASGLNDANDMAFDDKGNLFVRDGNTIFRFTPEGKKSTLASGVSPDKMAVDGAGNLFAADGNTIFKFAPDGKKGTFATGISYPGDLVFDGAGNLFVSGSGLIFKFTPDGTRSTLVSDRVSPDKQWEYHSDARIVKAGTSQAVLDLSKSEPENAKIVWAPDSKRFAFNYGQTCKHCTYDTIAFYQLRDDKWVALRSLVDERSERGQLAQLAKDHLPKSAHERRIWRSQPTHDLLKVREWIDANTAILYAYSQWFMGDDQEIPTEVADREVTEMTLARAAELEKRLKKVK